MASRPVAEGLFATGPDGPHLLGSRCGACGTVTFPTQRGCPRCGADAMAGTPLARRGRLFTFTTQGYLPKEPYIGPGTDDDFTPFGVGYVELPEVMVETRLTEADPDRLVIGMEMELVVVPFAHDPDGTEVLAFAFAPVAEAVQEEER
jgi:uncharacterized OB-fold protein